MKKYVEIAFNADLKNVVFARGVVASFFLDESYNLNQVNEVKTIVSEAVTNAIVHGYANDLTKLVQMKLTLENDLLELEVTDHGVGISDIKMCKEPLYTGLLNSERAGIGFTVMEVFSDNFEVKSEVGVGTTIYSTKNLN